jgi:hypothetical protein
MNEYLANLLVVVTICATIAVCRIARAWADRGRCARACCTGQAADRTEKTLR